MFSAWILGSETIAPFSNGNLQVRLTLAPRALRWPRLVLNHKPVPVWVFKSRAILIPVGVVAWDRLNSESIEMPNYGLPFILVRKIEDHEVLRGWLPRGCRLSLLCRELQVVAAIRVSEHNSVEASMVSEFAKHFEA